MQRTYSRKGLKRSSLTGSSPQLASLEHGQGHDAERQRKRQKVQVEIVAAPLPSSASDDIMGNGSGSGESLGLADAAQRNVKLRRALSSSTTVDSYKSSRRGGHLAGASASAPRASLNDEEKLADFAVPSPTVKDLSRKQQIHQLPELPELPTIVSPQKIGGVARRMLRRNRTEPSVATGDTRVSFDTHPSTPQKLARTKTESTIDFTLASPGSSGSRPVTPSKSRSLDDVLSPGVTTIRPSMAASNVRTYAGKSRSFLVAMPTSQIPSLPRGLGDSQSEPQIDSLTVTASQEDEFEIRESYTDLRQRWGVDNSEDDPYPTISPGKRNGKGKEQFESLPNGMMNDLKSISELRSKGESRRFLDEMGYLFEGLDPDGALAVRRGSALEIVSKLCDTEFARRAKAADFIRRTWDMLRLAGAGHGDKILDTILVFFTALVSRDPVDLAEFADKPDFTPVMYTILDQLSLRSDPLWLISCGLGDAELKRAGLPRHEKTAMTGLHKLIRQSGIFDAGEIISSRLLVSRTLACLPPSSNVASSFPSLLKSLSAELSPLPSRIAAYTSGLSLFLPLSSTSYIDTPSLLHVDNCLQLLDSYLLGHWTDDEGSSSKDRYCLDTSSDLRSSLLALCAATDVISRDCDSEDQEQKVVAQKCMESALRVLINLSHDNLSWCQGILSIATALPTIMRMVILSQRQRIEVTYRGDAFQPSQDNDEDDGAAQLLDRLCLALGLLTNLVQGALESKALIRDLSLDPHCPGKRSCTYSCRCAGRVSSLQCLAQVYLEQCQSESAFDSVVRGHMAVLFGLLMQDDIPNQRILLDALPGSSNSQKLDSLIENAREFTLFYATFAKKVVAAEEGGEDDEENTGYRKRDGSMGRVLQDTKGETVAKNVIVFLEALRRRTHD